MFTALKKLVTNEQHAGSKGSMPTGMQTMGQNLQRKFAKGVQYNMKIIIKGDRNTGKTTLFHRLQGERFKEEYIPTQEIQVASIQWNYKATDDVVKVEVWDVVDKGKSKKKSEGLKLDNSTEDDVHDEPCLDARFLDVYKGANGVVFMVDISKKWTWTYVERELNSVPDHIPILVLASFRDMADHRTVDEDTMTFFIDTFERPADSPKVLFAEASMKNGFGLKYLHTFFNVPFLQLQRETLLRQLETNKMETSATLDELIMRRESEDQNYELYKQSLEDRRKQKHAKSTLAPSIPNGQTPQTDEGSRSGSQRATPIKLSPATTPKHTTPTDTPTQPRKRSKEPRVAATAIIQTTESAIVTDQGIIRTGPDPKLPTGNMAAGVAATADTKQQGSSTLSQRFSKWFSGGESRVQQGTKEESEAVVECAAEITASPITSVEEFVPDEGLGGFLDEDGNENAAAAAAAAPKKKWLMRKKVAEKVSKPTQPPTPTADTESSEDDANPMVAGFQEELDSEDDISPFKLANKTPAVSSYDVDLSSEDEEGTHVQQDQDISDYGFKVKSPILAPSAALESKHSNVTHRKDAVTNAVEQVDGSNAASSRKLMTPKESDLSLASIGKADTEGSVTDEEQHQELTSRTSSQTTDHDTSISPASPMIQLQQEDFNFLESVGSAKKPATLTKKPSLPADDFDSLLAVTKDDDISDTDTMTSTSTGGSAVKKKKHKNRDKDDERSSSRKHKHKKHKNREGDAPSDKHNGRHRDKGDKKKKTTTSPVTPDEAKIAASRKVKEYDELEAFLEETSAGPGGAKHGPSYEAM